MLKRARTLIPVIVYCMIIFIFSSQEKIFWGSGVIRQFVFNRNSFFLHIVEYAILGGLLRNSSTDIPTIALFSAFYGVTDEIHQWFTPFRVMDPYDILANSIGGIFGIALVHAGKKMEERKK